MALRTATALLILLNLALGVAQVAQARSTAGARWSCCRGDGPMAYCCMDCCWWWGDRCRSDSQCTDSR